MKLRSGEPQRAARGCRRARARARWPRSAPPRRRGRDAGRRRGRRWPPRCARSWVMKMTPRPRSRARRRNSASSSARSDASSIDVGSSATSRRGSAASARASATRWRWPPDSSCGKRRAIAGARPTDASSSVTRASTSVTPRRSKRSREVVMDAARRVQRRERILEHHLHVTGRGRDREAAAVGVLEPGEDARRACSCRCPTRRRCATTSPALDVERDVVERGRGAAREAAAETARPRGARARAVGSRSATRRRLEAGNAASSSRVYGSVRVGAQRGRRIDLDQRGRRASPRRGRRTTAAAAGRG